MENTKSKRLPFQLADIVHGNRYQLRNLVNICFPVTYSDNFYLKVVELYQEFSRFCIYKDLVIGGVVGRIEKDEFGDSFLHILVLLVLPPYRKKGLAKKMIKFIEAQAIACNKEIKRLELHVQKVNHAAVSFYKNMEFDLIEEKSNYYSNLDDSAALYLIKNIN